MITILYAASVTEYFNNLVEILFEDGYFGLRESAREYVADLKQMIEVSLPSLTPRIPRYRRQVYGRNTKYITIRKNKHTSYYIFFLQKENIYIIKYIGNNHIDAQYLH